MDILTDRLPYDENWWTEKDIEMRVDGEKMGHRRISTAGVVAALQCFVVDGETRGNPLPAGAVANVYGHLKEGQRNARNASQPLAVFSVSDDAIQSHAITFLVAVIHVLLDAETHQEPSDTPHIEIHVSRFSMAILTTAHHILHVKDMLVSSIPHVTGWFAEHRTHAPAPSWGHAHFGLPTLRRESKLSVPGSEKKPSISISPPPPPLVSKRKRMVSIHESQNREHLITREETPQVQTWAFPAETNHGDVQTSVPRREPTETVIQQHPAVKPDGMSKVALFVYGTNDELKDSCAKWLKDRGPYDIQYVQTPQPFFGVWHDWHDRQHDLHNTFDFIAQFEAPPICVHMIQPNLNFTPDMFFQRYIRSVILKLKPEGVFCVSKDVCQLNKVAFGSMELNDNEEFPYWTREQLMQAAAKNIETHTFTILHGTRQLTTLRSPLACGNVISSEVLQHLDIGIIDVVLINFFINQCVTTWWPGGDKITMLNVNAINWDDWMDNPQTFLKDLQTLPDKVIFPALRKNHWFGCFPAECGKTPRDDGGGSGQRRKENTHY